MQLTLNNSARIHIQNGEEKPIKSESCEQKGRVISCELMLLHLDLLVLSMATAHDRH